MNNDFVVDSRFDCKVVLSDIYSEGLTVKSNLLKVNQDKIRSVLSQRSAEKLFLETLKRKDRIIWPPSPSVNEWTNLDHLVMNKLLQLPSNLSIQVKVNCLESSRYNKASDLFNFVPPPKKCLGGKNCRVNISIITLKITSLGGVNISEMLGGRENRLIICLIKILVWLVREPSNLGDLSVNLKKYLTLDEMVLLLEST